MKALKYGMNTHVIPVLAPVDLSAATIRTTHVKVSQAVSAAFLINFGVITNDTVNITIEESTSATTTGAEAIGFGSVSYTHLRACLLYTSPSPRDRS